LGRAHLLLYDRHHDRSDALAENARSAEGIESASSTQSARAATREADVVITAASFGPVQQVMTRDWLKPGALVVPVDYATYCSAEVVSEADLFLTDHVQQFEAARTAGLFEGWPSASASMGEALIRGVSRPSGIVVVAHLGAGLVDLVFANAIAKEASRTGLGLIIKR
jgi:ornithine cyclodeaminase/alanine dehydrogenase-like protein (mu-crystallin family)